MTWLICKAGSGQPSVEKLLSRLRCVLEALQPPNSDVAILCAANSIKAINVRLGIVGSLARVCVQTVTSLVPSSDATNWPLKSPLSLRFV